MHQVSVLWSENTNGRGLRVFELRPVVTKTKRLHVVVKLTYNQNSVVLAKTVLKDLQEQWAAHMCTQGAIITVWLNETQGPCTSSTSRRRKLNRVRRVRGWRSPFHSSSQHWRYHNFHGNYVGVGANQGESHAVLL